MDCLGALMSNENDPFDLNLEMISATFAKLAFMVFLAIATGVLFLCGQHFVALVLSFMTGVMSQVAKRQAEKLLELTDGDDVE
jgi:hypothetical protein